MEGMRAFAARHLHDVARDSTYVLCVDTVGSPHLVLAEAEGMLRLHRYDPELCRLTADCAEREGIPLSTGYEMRFGTDGLIALRHGLPAAMLTSVDDNGTPSNYHWPTDTPERVDYRTLADAVRLCEAAARGLATHTADALTPAGHAEPRARQGTAAAP
jgi:putative aminopeptidase FrvX